MDNSRQKKGTRPQDVRARNSQLLLQELSLTSGQTISELSKKLHLSRTAVQNIVLLLQQEGIITDGGKRDSTRLGGKRAVFYQLHSRYKHSIFVYLNSRFVIAEVYDFTLMRLSYRIGDVSQLSYPEMLQSIVKLIEKVLDNAGLMQKNIYGIAIAVSGTVDSENGRLVSLTGDNIPEKWGKDLPLVHDLREQMGIDADIYLDNMCNFSGLNSFDSLRQGPLKSCLYLLAHSRGVGATYIRDGCIEKGVHNLLGEVGHTVIDWKSEFPCRCGRKGCFEATLYPDAIRQQVNEAIWDIAFPDLAPGTVRSMDDLLRKANEGNPCALQVTNHLAEQFAQLLYNIQIMEDPACIIFHDSYSISCEAFHRAILSACREKTKGVLKVPIQLLFDTEPFTERVRKGAVSCLRSRFFDSFSHAL